MSAWESTKKRYLVKQTGGTKAVAQKITAEALKEVYFQDSGRRAGQLDEVKLNDVLSLEFDL